MSFRDLGRRNSAPPENYPRKNGDIGLSNSYHRQRERKKIPPKLQQNLNSKSSNSICGSRDIVNNGESSYHPMYNGDMYSYNPTNFTQEELQRLRVQQREEEYAISVMREREEELRDIHRKMHVVNEIYQDLGEVVDQQQNQIDAIEGQFATAAQNTKRGLNRLEKANEKSNKSSDISAGENSDNKEKCAGKYFTLDSIRRGASIAAGEISAKISAAGKMVSLCSTGSASYVHGVDFEKR